MVIDFSIDCQSQRPVVINQGLSARICTLVRIAILWPARQKAGLSSKAVESPTDTNDAQPLMCKNCVAGNEVST